MSRLSSVTSKRLVLGPQDHGTLPLHQYQISVEASRHCRDTLISQSDAEEVEVNARVSPRLHQNTPPVWLFSYRWGRRRSGIQSPLEASLVGYLVQWLPPHPHAPLVQLKNSRCCQSSHIAGPHHHDKVLAFRFSMQDLQQQNCTVLY